MGTDWLDWHADYADATSSLARRLVVVRRELQAALEALPPGSPVRLISMCSGDGRDVLPELAACHRDVSALLVELDPRLSGTARERAREFGPGVAVVTGDAGVSDPYLDADPAVAPADVLLACGVFGNVPVADALATISALPGLLAPGARVIWTRGHGAGAVDASLALRSAFTARGFTEVSITAPSDAPFRVGVHRWDGPAASPLRRGVRLFRFV